MYSEVATTWLRRTWKSLAPVAGSLLIAFVLIYLDIVEFGSYMFCALACPVWFVISAVIALVQRPTWRITVARVLAAPVVLLLAVSNYSVQSSIAMANAAYVIQACESYRTDNGSYPDRLDQLVPRYLKSIPRAKYCHFFGGFCYVRIDQSPILWWTAMPPFNKRVYDFERRTWRYLD
jgi:hypothetical protein